MCLGYRVTYIAMNFKVLLSTFCQRGVTLFESLQLLHFKDLLSRRSVKAIV